MSSGSFKDLSKALNTVLPSTSVPLPDGLLEVIQAYLEKHAAAEESDLVRLQEELFAVYEKHIFGKPNRLAPFLAALRALKPGIRGGGRVLQWWDKLQVPVLNKLGEEKGLASEARTTLLDILAPEEDQEDADSISTSETVVQGLIEVWLHKNSLAIKDFDDEAKYVEGQLQIILLAFGRKKPKAFLMALNKFFVNKDSRILVLGLLCEYFRNQPPHLHQMLQTPLFDNLLRCLQIDTSTRVISFAMTALIMFLPHIPSSVAAHLPALFNIYSRMLFWDKERRAGSASLLDDPENEKLERAVPSSEEDSSWSKLSYLLESDDESVPELMHYFTFLYGLYPLNFMSYIRKPQRYLRHANFPGAEELDVEPTEIRERSEPFRQVHFLHPNFFTMTIESELSDTTRWLKSGPADVVAECMALYNSTEEVHLHIARSAATNGTRLAEANNDVPEEPLLENDVETDTPFRSRHTSWRNTTSTIVASSDVYRTSGLSGLRRKPSQISHQSVTSAVESPTLPTPGNMDSPSLAAQAVSPTNPLQDMLNSGRSTRGSMYQSLNNDSVQSLALSHANESNFQVDTYLQSLSHTQTPHSPSLRPSTNPDPALRLEYLHREIQLLRNDLTFERYLKQQHLSHIGQLRRKQIRDARVEAETQNLINSNRALRNKVEEAKSAMSQMKKETEKSKLHSRKWEAELSAKLRTLREEQKKWNKEREELRAKVEWVNDDVVKLRALLVVSETRELHSQQNMTAIELNLDELNRLRADTAELTSQLRAYEANEIQAMRRREMEEEALAEVEILKQQLRARDEEVLRSKAAFENEIRDLRSERIESLNGLRKPTIQKDILDSAISVSRKRIVEIQKAYQQLKEKYLELQEECLTLKEERDQAGDWTGSPPMHSSSYKAGSRLHQGSRSPSPSLDRRRIPIRDAVDQEERHNHHHHHQLERSRSVGPPRLDTNISITRSESPTDIRTPVSAAQGAVQFHFGASASALKVGRESLEGERSSIEAATSSSNNKGKKAGGETRIYGRGGVQNMVGGKKEKEKRRDDSMPPSSQQPPPAASEGKKEKKSAGLRGLRGFG